MNKMTSTVLVVVLLPMLVLADFDVYFLRHGETTWNQERRLQGSISNTVLTAKGVRMAEETAKGMRKAGVSFDRVYTSPYLRASRTAEIVTDGSGLAPVRDERIREMCFGKYEGQVYGKGRWPDENLRFFFEDSDRYVPQGKDAESFAQVQARLRDFVERELRPLDGKVGCVLCVSHALVLKSIVREFGDDSVRDMPLQRNCSVSILHYAGGKFTIREIGKVYYDIAEFEESTPSRR